MMKLQFIFRGLFYFLLLSPIFCYGADYSIIYVHLGPRLPKYIPVALQQARLFNKDASIVLIASQEAIDGSPSDFKKDDISVATCESLTRSKPHTKFLAECTVTECLDGFWRKAIERFFYLHEYIEEHDVRTVFHIESDNMLYVDFSELIPAFQTYKGLGAVLDCDYRCIPSVVYVPHAQALKGLVEFMADDSQRGQFDMVLLASYRQKNSSDDIDNLPIIMPSYAQKYQLRNARGHRPGFPARYFQKVDLFQSIFDAAALGQFLGGIDPIHGTSQPGFVNETCIFDPSRLSFEWKVDDQGRKVPWASCNGSSYRINNLHIHSKNLEAFKS